MTKFKEFTLESGTKTLVNLKKINNVLVPKKTVIKSGIKETVNSLLTRITFNNDYIEVTESYEKVTNIIKTS